MTAARREPAERGDEARPDVTVVVISFNDAEHLADAVRSVTGQTLKNLEVIVSDDHSTDGTPDLVATLAAEDARVSYQRLPQNSGGCGAPRNVGLSHARGRYVMFLDSDDTLERHACKNLLLAAEATGADVVSGKTERVEVDTGVRSPWYGNLYAEPRVVRSLDEFPELLHDTVSTNKLYRRQFLLDSGLQFPEGIHYEDLVFTARLYTTAPSIAIIPELVYNWHVYASEVRRSITNQRMSERNLADRLAALDRVAEAYAVCGPEVQAEQARKVLTHHLRLYLNDMAAADDAWAHAVVTAIRPYVAAAGLPAVAALTPFERFLYACVLDGDVDGARQAVVGAQSGAMTGRFTRAGSAEVWTPREGDTPPPEGTAERDLLTVDPRLVRIPHPAMPYCHEVVSVRHSGLGYVLDGVTSDPVGRLEAELAELVVEVRTPSGAVLARHPATTEATGSVIRWSARIDAPARRGLREWEPRTPVVVTRLASGSVSTGPLRAGRAANQLALRDGSALGRALGDRWVLETEPYEPIELRIEATRRGHAVRAAGKRAEAALAPVQRLAARGRAALEPTGPLGRAAYAALRRLPLEEDLAFFESYLGQSTQDSPRQVYEALRRLRPDLTFAWSAEPGSPAAREVAPSHIVRRGSWGYVRMLARARYLVDNQSFPRYFRKRPGQVYLQTWHGIPLKRLGLDEVQFFDPEQRSRLRRNVRAWDGLVVPGPYFERVFVPAFDFRGDLLRYGSPRNDPLVTEAIDAARVRALLDLPDGARVVLYAPTFRERVGRRESVARLPFQLDRWIDEIGGDVVLLVRSHYLNRFEIPARFQGWCLDVSRHPDINELYAVADVLVTDYSSVMFDYALLRRPIVTFAPDYDDYVLSSRGTYFDLRTEAPGDVVETEDEFYPAVRRGLDDGEVGPQHELFVERYCGIEDGKAADRAAGYLLEPTR
ncbi:CDP-glycerol:poly(glycerophosphate)glycerophosph otransferase [Beutenbergia cavernae DSM 12333]|uniref:CDP-glycerol:poly(Glycerophosphate)glycerophosph otransferase n=1 Tax=Beutenbergia cavernae (strain ATCC BAA-8 / DSM 12333 / CCUG 43141 / JCM 11478 / NBRC 16432 / NCIMB 13614 / HKI 0122) TaxID=471853 RepID=C5C155_BEUC1|nr:CDP-glycerol glycerophosphotransferase family protein [Beutenbergia cavernae]ACQ79459.1 CDP-glycerol:poly(glycerophosphate)glycerophosph otransferase [Beutenbergia cavernae DSM 12333]